MAIDMSQFYQVFFEESKEHLAAVESLLVAIDPAAPDEEDLNAVFRAAHSIKGSSATFGFTDLTEVTHVMENLLDQVRKHERPLTEAIIDTCLRAGDVLRNLLAAHEGRETADHAAAEQIRRELAALCDAGKAAETVQPDRGYIVSFHLQCKASEHGKVLEALLAELRLHGRLVVEELGRGGGRGGRKPEPTRIRLSTGLDENSVRTLLEFVVEGTSLQFEEHLEDARSLVELEPYGLFSDEVATAEARDEVDADGAFGLFAPDEATTSAQEGLSDQGAFGLFAPHTAAEPLAQTAGDSGSMEAEDGSYGIFDTAQLAPKPVPQVAIPAPTSDAPKVQARSAHADAGSIRVSVDKVDQMINLVGELVITQAMLAQAASRVDPVLFEDLLTNLGHLERNTRDLQESVMSVRMLPISTVFSRFPRVVRDLSQKLGKKVQLVMSGEHTELDKTLIERITDPLTHLIRNSLDHGIELPESRRAAGKVEQGTISLRAYHQSGNIVIEVGDDGGGLRREKILAKALERGLAVHEGMSDQEVWMLIFEPGFSTAEVVTDVSGRGVGMDVVRKNIMALNGRIEIDSMPGTGTRVTVRLPLTLAILDGMSVSVGGEMYIIPLDYVVESLQPSASMVRSMSGAECLLQVRGEYLPIVSLREIFGIPGRDPAHTDGIMIVIECDGRKLALFVDQIVGQQQVVIKSLEANYRRVVGVAGATIMGDGHVALILDAAAIVSMPRRAAPAAA